MEWQKQRISGLEQAGSTQRVRKYDVELQTLRAEYEEEQRRLQEELAAAKLTLRQQNERQREQQQWQQEQHPIGMTQYVPPTSTHRILTTQQAGAGAWADLFDEPPRFQDGSVQAEDAGCLSAAEQQLLLAAQVEMERLQELNAALLESQKEGE